MQDIDLLQTNYQYLELYHVQTKTSLQLPLDSTAVNIGKYNNEISPDIDVSNLPNADIVSRTHAVIYLEISGYYIEDLGSSNGTYLNQKKLEPNQRYQIKLGDKVEFGRNSKVSFIFRQQIQQPTGNLAHINTSPTIIQAQPRVNSPTLAVDKNSKIVGFISMLVGAAIFTANTNVGLFVGIPGILLIIGGILTLRWGEKYSKLGWVAIALGIGFIVFGGRLLASFNLLGVLVSTVLIGGGYLLFKTGKVWKYSLHDVKRLVMRRGK
ncbi:MAG: FHA domain-containing protein [Mastigocoleus sp.]